MVHLNSLWLGRAEISVKKAIAGSLQSWTLTYTVGKYGIDDKGAILVVQRDVTDMEIPQFSSPEKSGYVTVTTTGDAILKPSFQQRCYIRPWRSGIVILIHDGALKEGDKITITFGDKSVGCPGYRVQTFREKKHMFKILVDPFGTGRYLELDQSPILEINGGEASKFEIIAPSIIEVDTEVPILLRFLDLFGNPVESLTDVINLSSTDEEASLPKEYRFSSKHWAVKFLRDIIFRNPGIHYIRAKTTSGLAAISNPILSVKKSPDYKLFWGDLHGQTEITIGTGTVEEYFKYARDVAGVDFTSWQGNDFQIEEKEWREDVCIQTKQFNNPNKFITLLGYEWSGITTGGGDHNIYFLQDDQQLYRSDHWLIEDKTDRDTDRYPISELWKTFKGRKDVMAIPHIGGRPANLDFFDPELIPVMEIYSQHGLFEWFAEEALERGLEVGFIAGSDDHTGRPGLSSPSKAVAVGAPFPVKGGLTGVFAKDLTRESIWEALQNRRCYATTGDRIILFFSADNHFMGEKYTTDKPPTIQVKVIGTSGIQEIQIRRGSTPIYNHSIPGGTKKYLKIEWSGARTRFRSKKTIWNGELNLDNSKILNAIPFAFDLGDEGIDTQTDKKITWKSTSAGDPDGIVLELKASKDSTLTFNSQQGKFKLELKEVEDQIKIINLGPFHKKVRLVPLNDSQNTKEIDFTYIDTKIKPGLNPYWIKIIQWNGEIAWSSPIFIRYIKNSTNKQI
ncbi:MAG: DUF3604 domain-containing protein [Promethearchaeota archaeon]